jgi:prepilin peptidase CpaA
LTLAIIIYRKSLLAAVTSRNPFLRHFADEANGVPYGIALGLGGLLTYPDSPLMVWALARLAA